MSEETRFSTFRLPLSVREGLSAVARHHKRFLTGHGRTGEPNMTWAICHLVERETRRIARMEKPR